MPPKNNDSRRVRHEHERTIYNYMSCQTKISRMKNPLRDLKIKDNWTGKVFTPIGIKEPILGGGLFITAYNDENGVVTFAPSYNKHLEWVYPQSP